MTTPDIGKIPETRERERAVIQIGEVNDALVLLMVLLDAAHDRKVSAEPVRCLLGPLQEKLEGALENLRDGFRWG